MTRSPRPAHDPARDPTRDAPARRPVLVAGLTGAAVLALGVAAAPARADADAPRTGDPELAARLGELLPGHDRVAAAVVTPSGTRFAGIGADETTSVEIGSVTKTFTALLLAQSAAGGALALDDRAADHLDVGAHVFTLEDLVTHRSGLPRLATDPRSLVDLARGQLTAADPYRKDLARLLAAVRDADVEDAGTVAYSNLGPAVAGQAVAAAEAADWADLLQERVAAPLGLRGTYAPVTPGGLREPAPRGVTGSGRSADPWTMHAEAPAGGIRSTAADVARYARALLADDPALGVPAATVLDPRHDAGGGRRIGLAWFTDAASGAAPEVTWHNGGTGGWTSMLALDRAAGTAAFVVVATGGAADAVDAAGLVLVGEAS